MQNEKIIYSAIIRKKHTILTEYTDCSGNFSQITKGIMDEIINKIEKEPNQYKAKFTYGKYIFHFFKEYNIYIITMSKPIKNKSIDDSLFFNFLFNIREDISKKIDFEDVMKLRPYSLSYYLPQFKEKVTQFNEGELIFNNIIIDKQNKTNTFELLNNKNFDEDKIFPILSNAQVHSEKNILPKEENNMETEKSMDTIDSFNEDILKSLLVDKKNAINTDDDSLIPLNTIRQTDFDLNFREKKRKNKWLKFIIPIILLIIIILVLLDIFVFKCIIKI